MLRKTFLAATVAILATVLATSALPSVALGQQQRSAPQQAQPRSQPQAEQPSDAPRGQTLERIAAVVNDEPITLSDLASRERLVILGANLPDTPESRERIRPQVLRTLIDETLQRQEARRANVSVTADEVKRGVEQIAAQNRMNVDQFKAVMAQHRVPMSAVEAQVRSALLWSKLVQRRLRPNVQVSEEDIDAAVQQLTESIGKPEYLVSEIFLSVDRPEQDDDVRQVADRLVDQMRGGAPFIQVARQFSQSAGAANGGELGWVQLGQLPEELDEVLSRLQPGMISPPIRSATGWHILYLRDRRKVSASDPNDIEVSLRIVTVKPPEALDAFEILSFSDKVENLRAKVGNCSAADAAAKAAGATISPESRSRVGELSPELGRLIQGLEPGQTSPVLRTPDGFQIVALCDRVDNTSATPDREKIAMRLGAERLEMLTRRLLRDLRRAAYVDTRI